MMRTFRIAGAFALTMLGALVLAVPASAAPQWTIQLTQHNYYLGRGTDPETGNTETLDLGSGDNTIAVALKNGASKGGTPQEEEENTVKAGATVRVSELLPESVWVSQAATQSPVLGHLDTIENMTCSLQQGAGTRTLLTCVDEDAPELKPGETYPLMELAQNVYVGEETAMNEKTEESIQPDEVRVSGGGAAAEGVLAQPLKLAKVPFDFSFLQEINMMPDEAQKTADERGSAETAAGGHPFELRTEDFFNTVKVAYEEHVGDAGGGQENDSLGPEAIENELPPGMVGDVQNHKPQCSLVAFNSEAGCPESTAVGFITTIADGEAVIGETLSDQQARKALIYNLEPPSGHPAAFGMRLEVDQTEKNAVVPVVLEASVRSDGDYGITVGSAETPTLLGSVVTFCSYGAHEVKGRAEYACNSPAAGDRPLLANPTQCEEQLVSRLIADRWLEPADVVVHEEKLPLFTGCSSLSFKPSVQFNVASAGEGGTSAAGAPSAMTMTLAFPEHNETNSFTGKEETVNPVNPTCKEVAATTSSTSTTTTEATTSSTTTTTEATTSSTSTTSTTSTTSISCPPIAPELRNLTLTLPEGVVLSPSASTVGSGPEEGLHACTNEDFGLGSSVEPAEEAHCPQTSQIGTVEVRSPDLPQPEEGAKKFQLKGALYVAQPECSPCGPADAADGKLFRLFLQLQDRKAGIILKLHGTTIPNLQTGRLTTTFEDQPQLPFEELVLHLKGGPRAVLQNPQACSAHEASEADLTAWSASPAEREAGAGPEIASEPLAFASECPTSQPFAPSFLAGSTRPAAGQYTDFALNVTRAAEDEQNLGHLEVHMPPGLVAKVAGIPLCGEAQANAGTCSAESQIGTVTVGVGAGPHPFFQQGRVYLTGPYGEGPFGLSIVVPTTAGPFSLEGTGGAGEPLGRAEQVVRSAIFIDPNTAAVTVRSNEVPQMLDGVPLRIAKLNVDIDRQGFELNPTNCEALPQGMSATLFSANGASTPVATSFDVGGCRALPFHPTFSASTQAKTSRSEGASLDVKITQHPGEAGIRKTTLQLPLALPSRLNPTLQHACTEAQFAANEEGKDCPEDAFVGEGIARTPLLNVPLRGPAVFISHGGRAFPDLYFLLKGEGVHVRLVGHTEIKSGITYSKFEEVPDTPIESFEVNLPEGLHSALAANGNLCRQNLVAPTTIVAQDGAQVLQQTKIAVSGCKPETKAEKLKAALAQCRKKDKGHKRRRVACERQARKKYGAKPKAKGKKHKKAKKHAGEIPVAANAFSSVLAAAGGGAEQAVAALARAAVATPARSAEVPFTCPNEARRLESNWDSPLGMPYSEILPKTECRAYEMVSPPEKQGFEAFDREPTETVNATAGTPGIPVSPSGEAAGFYSLALLKGTPDWSILAGAYENPYLARRGGEGWSTQSSLAPAKLVERPEPDGLFTDQPGDLISGAFGCGLAADTGYACARRAGDGEWKGVGPYPGTLDGNNAEEIHGGGYLGASADGSRIFIQPKGMSLLPEDNKFTRDVAADRRGIYEVAGLGESATPSLRLVNVKDHEELIESEVEQEEVGPELGGPSSSYHAISSDGRTVYFTALDPATETEQIYARVPCASEAEPQCETVEAGGKPIEGSGRRTEEISEPECGGACVDETPVAGVCEAQVPQLPACFEGASADGTKAFFVSDRELLPADKDTTDDLYEYDFTKPAGHRLTLLSTGSETEGDPSPGEHAEVQGVVRVSSDGSHVYFTANGVLTDEANSFGQTAGSFEHGTEAHAVNLYAVNTTGTPKVKFIARLPLNDQSLWISQEAIKQGVGHRNQYAQTTPDGRDLVFAAYGQLDSEDKNGCGSTPTESGIVVCSAAAIYRYDFESGTLTWVSHAAEGFPEPSEGDSATIGDIPVFAMGSYADINDWNRAVSGCPLASEEAVSGCSEADTHDGEDIIFTTSERLQAQDLNGAPDVYLWHCASPCEDPQTEGSVSLVSDGRAEHGVDLGSERETSFPAMSATGSDIFFFTSTPLVPQDSDELQDLYDARVDGGVPAPATAGACAGEACQGAIGSEPAVGAPGSMVFSSGQNVIPAADAVSSPSASTTATKNAGAVKKKKKHKPAKRRHGKKRKR